MQDTLHLQQEEHSCKILLICNKRSTHVRSSISLLLPDLVSGFRVTVSGLDDNVLFTYYDAQATPDAMVVINLPQSVNGQHVEVLIPGDGTQRQLILCEVEVFGGRRSGPEVINFSMLISTEHEISTAHKNSNTDK